MLSGLACLSCNHSLSCQPDSCSHSPGQYDEAVSGRELSTVTWAQKQFSSEIQTARD